MKAVFSWLPWWKPSVVVFLSGPLFDEARSIRVAHRRTSSGGDRKVHLDYVQVRHGLEDLRKVLSELGWRREVIFLLHDPAMRLHDFEGTDQLDDLNGHVEVILGELKRARPLARVLVWEFLPEHIQYEIRQKVEKILGKDRILTCRDLRIDEQQIVPPRTVLHNLASCFGLFF